MFWEKFSELCKSKGVSANGVAKTLGIASGTVTAWKNGRVPHHGTLIKISEYFDVSVDYLLGKPSITKIATQREFIDINDANLDEDTKEKLKEIEADAIVFNVNSEEMKKISNAFLQNKQKPADEGKLVDNDKVAKVALFGGDTEVTDEMWSEVMNYAEYIKQKYGKS